MQRKTDAMDAITQAYDRHHTTGDALITYATSLATAQQVADQALTTAITAVHNKTSAAWSKTRYVNLADGEDDQDTQRRYQNLVDDFQDDIDRADATISQAQADIRQAQTSRDQAAEQAVSQIQEITGSDGLNDSWWDNWGAKLTSILDAISAITGMLALVVQFIPIIGQALGAVLLVVAAVTAIASAVLKTVAAAQGHTSWANAGLSIAFAVLACTGLGALRGGFAAAKAAGGLKAFTGLGAKGILAGTGRNALTAAKGLGRGIVGLGKNAIARMRGFTVARSAVRGSRGINEWGGIIEQTGTNAADGRVFTSTGTIKQADFQGIVETSLMREEEVQIISGVHGYPDGTMEAHPTFFKDDMNRFGNLPGVTVYNLPDMSVEGIQAILENPGNIIGGFCNSAECLRIENIRKFLTGGL
jgi:hypothetical protein